MGKIVVGICCVGLLFLFGYTDSSAFRCGSGFVSVGDSKTKVMIECGHPTSKERVSVKKDRKIRKDGQGGVGKKFGKSSGKSVEKWYYNCGDNDMIYVLTFEGSTLAQEDTDGYGKGQSDCLGR